MTTGAGEPNGHPVGRSGQRADAQADAPDVEGGVTVDGIDLVDAVEPFRLADRQRTTGDDFLGGLEDHPNAQPAADQVVLDRDEGQSRAQADRDVDVVTARVGHPGHHRGVGQVGPLRQRQRIEVGSQGDPVCRVLGSQVGDQPRPGQQGDLDTRVGQRIGHVRGRAVFGEGQLRVAMDVAPEVKEHVLDHGEARKREVEHRGGHEGQSSERASAH